MYQIKFRFRIEFFMLFGQEFKSMVNPAFVSRSWCSILLLVKRRNDDELSLSKLRPYILRLILDDAL